MRVIFRADASTEIGSGHIMRCLTLAKGLSARGAEIAFVCRPQPGDLLDAVRRQGFATDPLPPPAAVVPDGSAHGAWLGGDWAQDADDTVAAVEARFGRADWIVVDHYAIDARWEQRLRRAADHLLVVDDLADRAHDCDILLDQNVDTGLEQRYSGLVNPQARMLLGPRFLLLREEFARARPSGSRDGNRALVFFGGVDRPGATLKLLETLAQYDMGISACVLVGGTNPARGSIEALCARKNYEVHVDARNVAEVISGCDFAIAACGFFAYELMALKTPALLTAQSDIQWTVAKALEGLGVAKAMRLTDLLDPRLLEPAIRKTQGIPRNLEAFDLVSTTGVEHIVTEMETFRNVQ